MRDDSVTATPPRPQPDNNDEENAADQADMPDPTAVPDEVPATTGPDVEAPASDPTVPPSTMPVDTAQRRSDTLGSIAAEMDGPSGADTTGGDITDPQDADSALEENVTTRVGEGEMQERQLSGEVETQTKDLKPSPAHPDEGMPPNPTGSENTGSANPQNETAEQSASGASATASGSAASGSTRSGNGAAGRSLSDAEERLLYLSAEFENYKRQVMRRETEIRERAVRSVLEDLLPVLDNFERALQAAKNARDVESLRVGIEYILQQLHETLKSYGVEPIRAQGQSFDPLYHEAVEEVRADEHPEGTVVEETRRGYSYKGQVLRPSHVKVAGGVKK